MNDEPIEVVGGWSGTVIEVTGSYVPAITVVGGYDPDPDE